MFIYPFANLSIGARVDVLSECKGKRLLVLCIHGGEFTCTALPALVHDARRQYNSSPSVLVYVILCGCGQCAES
jgi:hypothetical protein